MGTYTTIIIGDIAIEYAETKEDTLILLRDFIEDKIVTSCKIRNTFHGLTGLAGDVIYHIKAIEEEEERASSVWVNTTLAPRYNEEIEIEIGEKILLTDDEFRSGTDRSIHGAYEIIVDGISTMKDLDRFKDNFVSIHRKSDEEGKK